MKKYLLTFLMICWGLVVYSQENSFPKNEDGDYEFSEVIESSLSKSTLFANATLWAMEYFKDEGYKNVVQFESETDGRLIIKNYDVVLNYKDVREGKMHFGRENVYYTLTIDCKENKYRYVISDIEIKNLIYSPLFGDNMEYDMYHERHLERINEYNHNIDSLNTLKPNLKGKKLTKLQKQIDELGDTINNEMEMYNSEYGIFNRLIISLKKKMGINSDF